MLGIKATPTKNSLVIAGRRLWQMLLYCRGFNPSTPTEAHEGLERKQLKDVAFCMLSAGIFLSEFIPADQPWVHIDIAGPAFNEKSAYGYTPKGGTGAAVRTFVELVEDFTRD